MRVPVSISNKTKRPTPRLPFDDIKDDALGLGYELSLAFVGPSVIAKYNTKYRGKDKPTDVLSFSLGDKLGEIFICPAVAAAKAKQFGKTPGKYTALLFIHACLHLKGLGHGSRMDAYERRLCGRFSL